MTEDALRFRITELYPLATKPTEECEQHYVNKHVPMIVGARRSEPVPRVLRYRPHRAEAELMPDGTWTDSRKYWRFVFATFVREGAVGQSHTEHISADHRNWVQDMRSYEVANEIRLDRRSGQLASAKYLALGTEALERQSALEATRDRMLSLMTKSFGARMYLTNVAISEQEAVDDTRPRQRFTRNTFPLDQLRWYDEFYFDSERAGREFFSQPAILAQIMPSSAVVRVTEVIAFDAT